MTICRLVTSSADYRTCHTLSRQFGESTTLTWPTLIARWGDRTIGFMGTQPASWAVVMGPLIVAPDVRVKGLVALRLVDAYETVLRAAGIRTYVFHVDRANVPWLTALDHAGFSRWKDTDALIWFKREVV